MKNLINFITIIALFSLTITSCGKDEQEPIVATPTFEEQLIGEWVLSDIDITATAIGILGDTISVVTYDNGSTLEMNILENNEATLSGAMNTKMVMEAVGMENFVVDSEDLFNESRTWTVSADNEFELVSSVEDEFGVATLVDDKLVFVLTTFPEISEIDEEFSFDFGFDEFRSEITFTRK